MGRGGGRGSLRVWMWEEFEGWEDKGGEGDFWEPVRWVAGGEMGWEGGGFVFEEVLGKEGGWWGWMRGLVGMG